MAKDKSLRRGPEGEFIDKLFGDVASLSDEELDLLFETVAPGVNASVAVRELALRTATRYRSQNKVPPEHVLACLKKTSPESLEGAKTPALKKIVETINRPFAGPVGDVVFAHRNLKGVTEKDKKGIEELTQELKEDWEEEQ